MTSAASWSLALSLNIGDRAASPERNSSKCRISLRASTSRARGVFTDSSWSPKWITCKSKSRHYLVRVILVENSMTSRIFIRRVFCDPTSVDILLSISSLWLIVTSQYQYDLTFPLYKWMAGRSYIAQGATNDVSKNGTEKWIANLAMVPNVLVWSVPRQFFHAKTLDPNIKLAHLRQTYF